MKMILTFPVIIQIIDDNEDAKELFFNHKQYNLSFYAPIDFQEKIQNELNSRIGKNYFTKTFVKILQDKILKELSLVNEDLYLRYYDQAKKYALHPGDARYIAIYLLFKADGIWIGDQPVCNNNIGIKQYSTKSLCQMNQISLKVFADTVTDESNDTDSSTQNETPSVKTANQSTPASENLNNSNSESSGNNSFKMALRKLLHTYSDLSVRWAISNIGFYSGQNWDQIVLLKDMPKIEEIESIRKFSIYDIDQNAGTALMEVVNLKKKLTKYDDIFIQLETEEGFNDNDDESDEDNNLNQNDKNTENEASAENNGNAGNDELSSESNSNNSDHNEKFTYLQEYGYSRHPYTIWHLGELDLKIISRNPIKKLRIVPKREEYILYWIPKARPKDQPEIKFDINTNSKRPENPDPCIDVYLADSNFDKALEDKDVKRKLFHQYNEGGIWIHIGKLSEQFGFNLKYEQLKEVNQILEINLKTQNNSNKNQNANTPNGDVQNSQNNDDGANNSDQTPPSTANLKNSQDHSKYYSITDIDNHLRNLDPTYRLNFALWLLKTYPNRDFKGKHEALFDIINSYFNNHYSD